MINLVILDGSRIFGEAVAARLGREPDMRVLHVSTSADTLAEAVAHSSVDVIVCDAVLLDPARLDPELPSPRGLSPQPAGGAPARPAHRTTRASILVLADHADGPRLTPTIRWGARGWVPRDASADDLAAAVREVASGGTWVPPKVLTRLLDELTQPHSSTQKALAALTPREREVLICLSEGLNRMEVATRLHLSTNTVRTHVQSILSKLEVNSSVAAVALARKARLESAGAAGR